MHRLRSKASILRFRSAAFLLWLNHVAILVTVVFCARLIFTQESQSLPTALGLLLFLPLLTILRWIISYRTNCPLCLTPVLGGKNCSKHRRVRRVLGSHKIPVAHSILFNNSFCCPYCNESTVLELRRKSHDLEGKYAPEKE